MADPVSRVPLNDGWRVTTPAGPFARFTGEQPEVRDVRLPHDAMRDADRTPDAPSGGSSGYYPGGVWRYLRSLDVPGDWADRFINVTFDGAYAGARVYLDDVQLAHRPSGYARFHVDLTPHLRPGHTQELRVDVRTHLDSRWYSGAGLFRQVHLTVAGGVHLAPDGVTVTTPEVDDDLAAVEVVARVVNDTRSVREVRLHTELRGPDGAVLVEVTEPVTVAPGTPAVVRRRQWIRDPHRWSLDDPALHTAIVRVLDDELEEQAAVSDELAVRFGVRTVSVDPYRGFRLNGEALKLRGTCLHHDNGLLGAASHPAAERRRVRLLKEAGFNAIRSAHNPASQVLLDACDEVGMLVMNEAFDMWAVEKTPFDASRDFATWWERDLASMVEGSVNHPSVVMYSIGNEILELGRRDGRLLGRALAERTRALDPTRPVTNGIQMLFLVDVADLIAKAGGLNEFMGGLTDRTGEDGQNFAAGQNAAATTPDADAAVHEAAAVLDVMGYNYAEDRYAYDAEHHPQRVSVGSETFPTRIAHNWEQVMAHDQVIGDFTWTGWDYLGEAGIGGHAYAEDGAVAPYGLGYPNLLAGCGDIDITGYRKTVSHYREIAFGLADGPFLAVQRPERYHHTRPQPNAWQWSDTVASWSWPGFEDAPVRVEVYARADEVELLLDGESLGRAAVGEKRALVASFDTVWRPGELTAVAHTDGQEVGRTTLRSAGPVAEVRADAERAELHGTDDLGYVAVALTDAQGEVVVTDRRPVSVAVEGPAELAGFGTGAWRTEERFDATTCTPHDGRAQAIVRTTGPGTVRVRITAEGLPDAVAEFTVR
ncbi:glycoside hydrolase family 2 TIM barrel-domain containing protein [Propioniciclava soli]|uniref:Glycoside hydrolase family 2 TIM barrel-domain containing protein n=1 Tax=Propioniciclava soli TaxID=2775081 RepID=A0ABZ3C2J2_9ACTN